MKNDACAALLAGRIGDPIGARRLRRSFRLCVTFSAFFAAMMWFTENFLRYEPSERLYLAALTHEPESARPFLMQAVKIDKQTRTTQTPKYLEALAEREEREKVIDTYAAACRLDPQNPSVRIRYGCQLALAERWAEAQAAFAKAAELDPQNALPAYLEASTLPFVEPTQEAFKTSLDRIARTNGTNRQMQFPKPQWFSALPTDGMWYARLTREAVDEALAPLYGYANFLTAKAADDAQRKRHYFWKEAFETLFSMGGRLVETARLASGASAKNPMPGVAPQAIAGLTIQRAALDASRKLATEETASASSDKQQERAAITDVLNELLAFESQRDALVQTEKARRQAPLTLWVKTFALLALCYLLAYALAKAFRVTRETWALRHPSPARAGFAAFPALMLLLLGSVTAGHMLPGSQGAWIAQGATWTWTGIIVLAVLFGPVYPLLILRTLAPALAASPEETGEPPKEPGRRRLQGILYAALVRRYYGILCGLLLTVASIWVVVYRIETSLYPWQFKLLTSGFAAEEMKAVGDALSKLQP
ncbi:MAG TPA: hypothetical protein PLO62_01050 [Candidatus Hydrogenedentes bacterium]|nr:hypothetical protein [Candidatus Hydrogenedentota bacterium]